MPKPNISLPFTYPREVYPNTSPDKRLHNSNDHNGLALISRAFRSFSLLNRESREITTHDLRRATHRRTSLSYRRKISIQHLEYCILYQFHQIANVLDTEMRCISFCSRTSGLIPFFGLHESQSRISDTHSKQLWSSNSMLSAPMTAENRKRKHEHDNTRDGQY